MFLIIQGTSDFHLLLLFSHIQARVSVPHADTATRETHCEHQNNLLLCYLYSLQHGLRTRSTCIFIRPQRPFLSPTLSSSSSSLPLFCSPTSTIPPQKAPTLARQFLKWQCTTTEPRKTFHQYSLWSLKVFFGFPSTISGNDMGG